MDSKYTAKHLLDILPHRFPFLLVDRVLSLSETEAVAVKNVTFNEPFFQGHFPEAPIMPGVLIVEAMAQLGGVFTSTYHDPKISQGYLTGMERVRFRKPVHPGDQLRLHIKLLKKRGQVYRFQGTAYVDEDLVCEAEILIIVRETLNAGELL